MVTTKVRATGSFMHQYSLQLTLWRSDLLTCASFTTVLRNTNRIQNVNSQEDLVQWACVLSQGIFLHVQKALLYFKRWHIQRRDTVAPYVTHASLPFSSKWKTWGYSIGNISPSLFHWFPLKKTIPAHRKCFDGNSHVSPCRGTTDNPKPLGEISQLSLHSWCRRNVPYQKLTAKLVKCLFHLPTHSSTKMPQCQKSHTILKIMEYMSHDSCDRHFHLHWWRIKRLKMWVFECLIHIQLFFFSSAFQTI